eukprot:TRINITY_DN20976_c0_g1_i4.p1 TRINITY_DN20976_c0_g1~~TRINITY_DN20976_c0_g1_i4.p1  ORF type:complete len:324 (-),score=95.03 TRINITY_DN20976_c0_g1_i4:42-992(-)
MNGSDGESRSASSNENMLEHKHLNVQSLSPPATTTPSNLLPPESPPRSRLLASPGSIQPTFLCIPFPSVTISCTLSSSTLSQSSSHPAQSPPVSQVTFISEHPVNLCPSPVELQLPAEDDFLYQSLEPTDPNVENTSGPGISMWNLPQTKGSFCPHSTQPLITVTINPLETNEVTFIPPSPMLEKRNRCLERKSSIGSSSSIMEDEDMNMLGLSSCSMRRVSDISTINQLRREISGMNHLASEYYSVRNVDDPDNLSLDSLHVRTLSRCAKYQDLPPSSQSRNNKYFVIITTTLTIIGISCGFWFKNFSGISHFSH